MILLFTAPISVQFNLSDSVWFSPPIQVFTSEIKTAFLWLYIKRNDSVMSRPYITLTIKQILPESIASKKIITKTFFSQEMLPNKAFGWKRIDMRHLLNRWIKRPVSNQGLVISAEDDLGNNLVVLPETLEETKDYVS